MKVAEFIEVWDGFIPFVINAHYADGVDVTQIIKTKNDCCQFYDGWKVEYITTACGGEIIIECMEV